MMGPIKPEYLEHELKRWMRPDARNFIRPDWRRFVKPGSDLAAVYELYEQKYRPDQERVPPGSRDGGQWADEGGEGGGDAGGGGGGGPREEVQIQVAARISASRRAECEIQQRQDTFICNAIGTRTCWEQAAVRFSQCLKGGYVPPFYH
jgi:hypothetical protein